MSALEESCTEDRRSLRLLERVREREDAREEERATLAVRAAAKATSSERRRFALAGLALALLTVLSPHIHHLP